jgi:hypothetical protein
MTGAGDPPGASGSTGGVGSPLDPAGSTGSSSGPNADPQVNQDNVLGSWDSKFLYGADGSWGNPGWSPDGGIQNLIGDLTSLIRDLTNLITSLVGAWSADVENGNGVGSPGDWSGSQGSVGSLDDGGNHHHHHHPDMWRPDQG